MKVYAIRQKSTGFYLPETGGCYTRNEPVDVMQKLMPRIFAFRESAAASLRYWLKGVHRINRDSDDSLDFEIDEPYNARDASDMEVVELELGRLRK